MDWKAALDDVIEIVKAAPQLVQAGADLVDGAQKVWSAVTSENPPTPDQQAAYDAALQESHDALQRS